MLTMIEVQFATRDQFLPELGGETFGERYPSLPIGDFYRWKYFESPLGPALIGIATVGRRVVSTVAAVPKRILCGGDTHLVYELGDFLTASDYRNQGLFSRLIELVCESARSNGAAFVYVQPNDVSFPILSRRLGFHEPRRIESRRFLFPSRVLEKRLRLPGTLFRLMGVDAVVRRKAIGRPAARGLEVVKTTGFDDETDALWEEVSPAFSVSIVRDSAYLNWRYAKSPTPYQIWKARRQGALAGFTVAFASLQHKVAYLLELFTGQHDLEASRALVAASFDELLQQGVEAIYTWTLRWPDRSAAQRVLTTACPFVEKGDLHLAMRFLGSHLGPENLSEAAWQFAAGDFDGF
jgi:GNAT superfamily N-acetyltransferase